MSYFDDASLVMIPSGYKDQKVYSVKPIDGSGDLTFSRASNATRVNSSGLVEKVRTNLVLQSNTFNTTWTTPNVSVTGGQTDPDGGTTAWLVTETVDGGSLRQAITATGSLTFSFTLKANTGTTSATLFCTDASQQAAFDLSNGTFSESGAVAKMVSLGNGWYRCSISFTASAASTLILFPSSGAAVGSTFATKAQLETGDIATDYIATTSAAVSVGPVSGLPRLDYSGGASCPSLLLEPQRSNLLTFSEQINNAAFIGSTPVTANAGVSPDGYTNADAVKESATAAFHIKGQLQSFTSGTAYTFSFFAKADGRSFARVLFGNAPFTTNESAYYNLTTGATSSSANCTASMVNYGNGWWRCVVTATANATATDAVYFGPARNMTDGYATYEGNPSVGIYAWGAQLEAAAYATSYIPTLSSAVTRVADTYQKGGFGNTSTAGTLYYEFEATNISSPNGQYLISLFAGSSVGGAFFADGNAITLCGNGPQIQAFNNGYSQLLFTTTPAVGSTVKVALRYDGTNVVAFLNGVKQTVFADTAVGVKNAIRVNNAENGTQATKQLLFFPIALSDADAITLTTL